MPEVIYDVELREKDSNNVFDIIYHPVTKVENVVGLVDVNHKFNLNLFPDWMFTTKRNAGALIESKTLAQLLTQIKNTLGLYDVQYLNGAFVTANASVTVGASENHIIINGDEGAFNVPSASLEVNDAITFIGTREIVLAPNSYEFQVTTSTDYNSAGLQWNLSGSAEFPTASDIMSAFVTAYPQWNDNLADAWDHSQGDGVVRYDNGFGYTYWRFVATGTPTTQYMWSVTNNNYPLATTSVAGLMSAALVTKLNGIAAGANNYTHPTYTSRSIDTDGVEVIDTLSSDGSGHVTAATKRSLPNATQSAAGVMSASDKTKLDGIDTGANNYAHPTQTAIDVNATDNGISVIDRVTVNTLGHVTFVGSRNLSAASTSAQGVVQLATDTQAKTGTASDRVMTPANVKAAIDWFAGLKTYSDLTAANNAQANHAVGSLVLVRV